MSQLLDKIKKQSEKPAVPMGFRRSLTDNKPPSILLIARATVDASGTPVKQIEGADAVLLESPGLELTEKSLKKITEPLGKIPWGIFIEESKGAGDWLNKIGCDFFVFTPATPVTAAPAEENTGKIIQVESSMDDGLLRALNDLPVDAVLAADSFGDGGALSYHHLMLLRYMGMLTRKPLIVPAPASITSEELKALWDAGIQAVLVTVDVGKDENLKELHAIAAELPPRKVSKDNKINVRLPRSSDKAAAPPPEEEEEEEDE
jgi:hypothetical protein